MADGRDLRENQRSLDVSVGWQAIAKQSAEMLYRAIDKCGKTLDLMLSERRDEAAATAFFAKVISSNGWPDKVVIDDERIQCGRSVQHELSAGDALLVLVDRRPAGNYLNNII